MMNKDKINVLINYAYGDLERTIDWLHNCETKLSLLLTLIGFTFAYIFTSIDFPYLLNEILCEVSTLIIINMIILSGGIITLLCSLICVFTALRAKVKHKPVDNTNMVSDSLLYFGTISNKTFNQFNKHFIDQTDENRLIDISSQIYINSKIISWKLKHYNLALTLYIISFFMLVTSIAYQSFR